MKKSHKQLMVLGFFLIAALTVFMVMRMFNWRLEHLFDQRDRLLAFVHSQRMLSSVVFVLTYIVVVAVSIPGATVLTLLGGFLFGPALGLLLVNIGASSGAILIFLAARYIMHDALQSRYGAQLAKLNGELEKNGASYLLTLRFIPLFPFFLINLLSGLTPVSLFTYTWTTVLGIIPGSLVYILLGSSGATLDTAGNPFSPALIAGLILLALVSLIPVLVKKKAIQEKQSISSKSRVTTLFRQESDKKVTGTKVIHKPL
jgi:uncharacterized membrane protein YdjX (TVP38/TMEM64 family)